MKRYLPLACVLLLGLLLQTAAGAEPAASDSLHKQLLAAYQQGFWQECTEAGLAAVNAGPVGPQIYYDIARCYAYGGNADSAFCYLDLATEHGFISVRTLVNDPAFVKYQEAPLWMPLVGRMRERQENYLRDNDINIELFYLKEAELQSRLASTKDDDTLRLRAPWRQSRVHEIVESGALKVPEDYYAAALILEASPDTVTRRMAVDLSTRAMSMDSSLAELRDLYRRLVPPPPPPDTLPRYRRY